MTIIAAMWESDNSILIAADSGLTEMPSKIRSLYPKKLQRHPTAPLAWGTVGNLMIGIDCFSKWLQEYDWPPKDLTTFQFDVAQNLSEWNGRQRQICRLAGTEAGESDLTDALIIGILNTPFIFHVDDKGVIGTYDKEQEFHAIGSGAPHAMLVHAAFRAMNVNALVTDKLRIIVHIAADKAQQCSPPIHIWRVSKEGIEEIEYKKQNGAG